MPMRSAPQEATAYESTDLSNSQCSSALTAALRQCLGLEGSVLERERSSKLVCRALRPVALQLRFQGDHGPLSSTTISQASASDAGGFPVWEAGDQLLVSRA